MRGAHTSYQSIPLPEIRNSYDLMPLTLKEKVCLLTSYVPENNLVLADKYSLKLDLPASF